jgi:integrase
MFHSDQQGACCCVAIAPLTPPRVPKGAELGPMTNGMATDRQVLALKPQATRYERTIAGARGLCLIVYPTGTKTFVLRYVALGGERRRLVLGEYPGLSLADAKDKAAEQRVSVVNGADPAAARVAARAAARSGETLAELAEAYWKASRLGLHGGRRRPKRESTISTEKIWWENYIEPVLGQRRFCEIKRADVKQFMHALATQNDLRPASVASGGAVLSNILAYAVHDDRLEANPAVGLTRPMAWSSRARLFNDEALGVLLKPLIAASVLPTADKPKADQRARLGPEMALAIRFLIVTLTRRTEVAGARWVEIDLKGKTWTISAERTKTKRLHIVPLSDDALALLSLCRGLPGGAGEFVFPSPKDPSRHLDPHAITRAVTRLCTRLKLPAGSPHDFRRSGATALTGEALGVRQFIVGKVLGLCVVRTFGTGGLLI